MTTEVRTPFATSTIELADGGLWKKQILKFGSIWYTDRDGHRRKITFDRKYGEDLVRAFREGAYPQVPLQFADGDNRHNNDPLRTHGEVVGLQLSADGSGVDGVLRTWGRGGKVIEQNPNLGVSARILENLSTSDGRQFPRAVQHVLATVDPQVRGMSPWQRVESVDLANAVGAEMLDLSAATYERSAGMPQKNSGDDTVTLELSAAQAERLERILEDDEALEALAGQLGPDFLDLEDEKEEDEEDEEPADDDKKGGKVELSGFAPEALELATAQIDSLGTRVIELTNQLVSQQVDAEVRQYAQQNLAPAVIELARPLLASPPGTIELSNGVAGQEVDPGQVVRELLDTVIELANSGHLLVDPDSETGSLHGEDKQTGQRQALLDAWATYDA